MTSVVITARGADGAELHRWYAHLSEERFAIRLPEDAHSVELVRLVRIRVDLRQHRAGRRVPASPRRPSWRDDSEFFMWLRWWRARREGRRVARQKGRSG